ncbi:hypothetical protein SLE2022_022910 [Rubroshorea leprosula]
MGRQPCCDKLGVKKGPWTAEEDRKLVNFILTHGHCCWRAVPKLAGLRRCGKSCRLRWTNYLRPDLKRGLLNEAEEQLIIELHARLGNKWSKIAAKLPGRTDNEIKNHWNTHIKKKLTKMGIDPVTHQPLQKPPVAAATSPEEAAEPSSDGHENDHGRQRFYSSSDHRQQDPPLKDPALVDNSSIDMEVKSSAKDDLATNVFWAEGFINDNWPPWDFLDAVEGYGEFGVSSTSSENSSWLLDYQTFSDDIGFGDGFMNEVDMNVQD